VVHAEELHNTVELFGFVLVAREAVDDIHATFVDAGKDLDDNSSTYRGVGGGGSVLTPVREVGERVHVDFDLYGQQTGAADLGVESLDTVGCVSPSRNPLERLSGVHDANQSSSPSALLTSHIRVRPAESQKLSCARTKYPSMIPKTSI
jgi:hypothetical protein